MTFWRENEKIFPHLSQLARMIHSILATSAGVEWQFFGASLTMQQRRTSLCPEQLDNIFLVRSVQKMNKQLVTELFAIV